jgi:hypothetical protein
VRWLILPPSALEGELAVGEELLGVFASMRFMFRAILGLEPIHQR